MSGMDGHPERETGLRRIEHETVSAADGPVGLYLHGTRLQIVESERDLGESWNVDYLIVEPAALDGHGGVGFKGVGDGESVVLGRGHEYGRFRFPREVSRDHVRITRRGTDFEIEDLGSTNGTYLETAPPRPRPVTAPETATDVATVADAAAEAAPETESVGFRLAGETAAKETRPDDNEDAYFVDPDGAALGVFDGLGGHPGSGKASEIAARSVAAYFDSLPSGAMPRTLAREAVRESLQQAHEDIVREREGNIATTGTVAKAFESETGTRYLVVGSVGDSRAYLFRDGGAEHITLDQAFMPGLSEERAKRMQETLAQVTDLSELNDQDRAAFYNRNVISGALGEAGRPPVVVLSDLEVHPGDRVLITSDGIHDNLTDAEVEEILRRCGDPDAAVRELVAAAQARSRDESHVRHKPDDMTAAVLDCDAA